MDPGLGSALADTRMRVHLSRRLLTSSSSQRKFCRFCTHSKKLTVTPPAQAPNLSKACVAQSGITPCTEGLVMSEGHC